MASLTFLVPTASGPYIPIQQDILKSAHEHLVFLITVAAADAVGTGVCGKPIESGVLLCRITSQVMIPD
jgi:hypothetical protein